MRRPDGKSSREAGDDLTSRADVKRANRVVEETLARLSVALSEMAPRRLAALDLPEAVVDAVLELRVITDARARRRQLGLVRVALRHADWAAIQEQLRHEAEGRAPAPHEGEGPAPGSAALWVARLLGEGFAGLDAFIAEYPRTDRARLLDLVHRVDRSSHERRAKAERKLTDVIASILASGRG